MGGTDPVPLYGKLKDLLKADITAGKLAAGDRIPSERLLADTHGVSRITVKKAIADLIVEGWLEHIPHRRGTFVRPRKGRAGAIQFIAVAIDDVRNSFGAQILRGIEDFLWGRRIHTLICNADRDFAKVEEYFRSLLSYDVAGVIFAPVIDAGYREGNLKLVGILEKAQIPYTLIDRFIPRLLTNYVGANHEESSHILTRYLIDHGHKRVLLVRGMECTSMDEREQGFRAACEEAGLTVDERLIVSANDNLLEGEPAQEQVRKITEGMRRAGTFTCLYALNDGLLRAGITALVALGKRPGADVQLASHNEVDHLPIPQAQRMPHFVEPTYEMGWEAARVLLEHINDPGRSIVQKVLKSRFVRLRSESPVKTSPAFPMVLGHRGFPARYPENTLLSFRKAFEAGADGIECDLQKTRDGRYVVIHDDTVQRTSTGSGAVADLTFDEMRRLDFGAGERIPTLEEMLATVPAGKYLDLELKSETITPADFAPLSAVLEKSFGRSHLMISSFRAALLYPFRRRGYTVGYLVGEEVYAAGAAALARLVVDLRPQFLNLPVKTMERIGPKRTRFLLGFLRFLGVSVLWWTVDDIRAVEPVKGSARMLVTNDPEGILKALRR